MKHCMLMSVLSLLFSPAAAGHGAARRRDLRGETLPEVSPPRRRVPRTLFPVLMLSRASPCCAAARWKRSPWRNTFPALLPGRCRRPLSRTRCARRPPPREATRSRAPARPQRRTRSALSATIPAAARCTSRSKSAASGGAGSTIFGKRASKKPCAIRTGHISSTTASRSPRASTPPAPGIPRAAPPCGGGDVPYLVSVSSPETASDVPNFVTTAEFSPESFREKFLAAYPDADLSAQPPDWIGERTVDPSGRVSSVRVGDVSVPGTKMRSIFSLRSANFRLAWTGRSFLFTVSGSGHGAGMSQYGANVMAKNGSTWQEILTHYYPGTSLTTP